MIFRKLTILVLVCCSVMLTVKAQTNCVRAQNNRVKFSFEVDAKPVKEKFKVQLYLDGKVIEPDMCGDSFLVPPEIEGRKDTGVRFLSDKYDLYFDPIFAHNFKIDWVVGVDNKPFEKENLNAEKNYEKVAIIHYLKFIPKDGGDGFMLIVEINKRANPKK